MTTESWYRLAADVVLLLHVLFVIFVVAGLALIFIGAHCNWRWVHNRAFRVVHLAAIGIVVVQSWLGAICPLTTLELSLRSHAGDATYRGSFIAHWLEELLYFNAPNWVFMLAYTAFAALVVASWFLVPPATTQRRR